MGEKILIIKDLHVKYGGHDALENIHFELEEGAFAAVVGPNGSGKSTLLKSILGILKPHSGEIQIFGEKCGNSDFCSIGYVPQTKTFDKSFPATALELVVSGLRNKWPGKISPSEKEKALNVLKDIQLETLASRNLSELSGGELQRAFFARAIVKKPKLLLLDEPITGVDLVCESIINDIIEDLNEKSGLTILMVTHDWTVAKHHANQILLVNRRQIFFGSPEKAFQEKNIRKAFVHAGSGHFHEKGGNVHA